MLQLWPANFVYVFNPFKMVTQLFWIASSFPNFDCLNALTQVQQTSGPDFKKVRKSLLRNSGSDLIRNMRFPTIWYVRPAKTRPACAYEQSDPSLC